MFEFAESKKRIKSIISEIDVDESDNIPEVDFLTYKNAIDAEVTSLSIDLRGSTKLLKDSGLVRKTIAKIMRSYISEVAAVVNSYPQCKYVQISGDGLLALFDGRLKPDLQSAFDSACKINSVIKLLNSQYKIAGYKDGSSVSQFSHFNTTKPDLQIKVGIGIDCGKALMIKAGYAGSGINEILWIGACINNSVKMAKKANLNNEYPMNISGIIYANINDHSQKLCNKIDQESYGSNAYWPEVDKFL
jgi:hypothetical protein